MPKLSEYVETAAMDYVQETGKTELDALWLAEFFQDAGVMEDYPHQDLVTFYALVQKALTKKSERADKQALLQVEKVVRFVRHRDKP